MFCSRWWCCQGDGEQVPGKFSEDTIFRLESKSQISQQKVNRIMLQVKATQSPSNLGDCGADFFAELSLADQQFGMDIRVDKQHYVLKVGAVKGTGAVASWNERNPGAKIEVGDTIVMVNGETETLKMLKTKTKDKKFVMAIKKATPPTE